MGDETAAAAAPDGHDGSDEARVAVQRLVGDAGLLDALGRLADNAERYHGRERELARELSDVEELRAALVDRMEAANERLGAAERLVEEVRVRLVDVDERHTQAATTLRDATEQAATIVADAEARAQSTQDRADREAVERVRRAEREAADRLAAAEADARRIADQATEALEQAERTAAEMVAAAHEQVERLIEDATRARHRDVERLQEQEQAVHERIRQLLADDPELSHVRRAAVGRAPAVSAAGRGLGGRGGAGDTPLFDQRVVDQPVIDLTEEVSSAVSAAVRTAIDDWVHRRDDA